MCMSLMQRFITSTGQSEPAMIPVRSEDRSWSANVGWFCIAMNIVGTPYTAVQRSSAIAPQRGLGVEAGRGDHHRGAVGGAAEVAHHHPEAVVEGHRDAEPVLVGEVDQLGDEVAVVEDVAVRQRRALGVAGRARRVLDVDRVVRAAGSRIRSFTTSESTCSPAATTSVPVARCRCRRPARGRAVSSRVSSIIAR